MGSSPVEKNMRAFKRDYGRYEKELLVLFKHYVKQGYTPERATKKVLTEKKFKKSIENMVLSHVATRVRDDLGEIEEEAFKKWYLKKTWPGEEMSLSSRTIKMRNRTERYIAAGIKRTLQDAKGWKQIAKSLTDIKTTEGVAVVKGNISNALDELVNFTNKQSLTEAQRREYTKAIRKVKRSINGLSERTAISKRLKKAQASLLKKIEAGEAAAIDRGVDRVVKAKARYNASRIARTELQKAHKASANREMADDTDIVGWRSILSDNRPVNYADSCDMHAEADFYGMGKGVYPRSVGVMLPYHPNCMCFYEYIYRGEVNKGYNHNAGADWVKENPEKAKRAALKRDADVLKDRPDKWENAIVGAKNPQKEPMPIIPKQLVRGK